MAAFNKNSALKLIELILVIILLILHYNDGAGLEGRFENFLAIGSFVGYLIILVGAFAGLFMGSAIGRHTDLFFSIIGLVLFLVVGGIAVSNGATLKGILAIVEGVIFLVDAIFAFRGDN